MFYWLIPLIVGIVLLSFFLYFRGKGERKVAVIIKGFVSLAFIITGITAWKLSSNPDSLFGLFVVIGLCFGLLGDIFLDLKFIITEHELLYTILGFMTFLVGHIFYVTALLTHFYNYYSSNILYLIIPIIVAVALATATILLEKVGMVKYNKMKPYVAIYALMLFFTLSIYFSVTIQNEWKPITLIIMSFGLISFALSDLILNTTYFGNGFDKPVYIVLNHFLYYVGQFAIAVALFYLV